LTLPAERPARVTAVVLNWNTADLCISTVESLAGAFSEGLRIVLVDNGSQDDSAARLRSFLTDRAVADSVELVESETNLGFTGGVNLGTRHALAAEPAPDFIWLLNPDAHVVPETARELVAVARESGAGIASAPEGGPGMAGHGHWPQPFYLSPQTFMVRRREGERWLETGRCAGWCAVVDARLAKALIARDGHFEDERLFLDWDEWDLTLRAKALGWRSVAALRVVAEHDGFGRTFGTTPMAAARQYYQSRNAIAVARRNLPAWQFWPMLAVRLARDFSWFARLRLRGTTPNEKAYVKGLIDGLRGATGRWKHHPESPLARR